MLGIDTELQTWQLIAMGTISFLVGLTGGIVGIALGVIRLPMLTFFGVDPLVAAGTNLFISVMGSTFSTVEVILEKRILWSVVLAMGGPAILGAFVGGYFSDFIPLWLLLTTVALLMVWSSIWLVYWSLRVINLRRKYPRSGKRKMFVGDDYKGIQVRKAMREGMAGLILGVIGGAVGLVLGVLRMPALLAMRIEPHTAAGTNLAITALVGVSGFSGHILNGNIDWLLVLAVGIPGTLGMLIGTKTANRFDPVRLRLTVGVVILLVAPFVLLSATQS